MEFKDISNAVKEYNADAGTFTGWAAYYNNVDLGGDVILPGAFARTMKSHECEVPICWQHDLRTPIGMGRITDVETKGLQIFGQLSLGSQAGKMAHELMKPLPGFKRAPVRGLSIGYEAVKHEMVGESRHLREVKLYEISPVTVGMNPKALITDVKVFQPELSALNRQVAAIIQALMELKTTLVDQGLLSDSDFLHSLDLDLDAGLGKMYSDSLNDVEGNDPACLDEHSLELLRDMQQSLKRGTYERDGNSPGSQEDLDRDKATF